MCPLLPFSRFSGRETKKSGELTWRVCRYHGTMDVQQERLNVYFNEVMQSALVSKSILILRFRRLVENMSLELSWSISSLGQWMLLGQAHSVISSVPITLFSGNLVQEIIGLKDSTRYFPWKC